jgi:hypothetical protein
MTAPFVMITTHRVPSDRLDEFEALTRTYLDRVEAGEPRAQVHSAYVDASRAEVALLQVHPDAAAADQHMQVAHDLIGQGLALADTLGVEVYGEPGPVLRQALDHNRAAGVPVTVKPAWAGFTRLATGPGPTEAGST